MSRAFSPRFFFGGGFDYTNEYSLLVVLRTGTLMTRNHFSVHSATRISLASPTNWKKNSTNLQRVNCIMGNSDPVRSLPSKIPRRTRTTINQAPSKTRFFLMYSSSLSFFSNWLGLALGKNKFVSNLNYNRSWQFSPALLLLLLQSKSHSPLVPGQPYQN